MDAKRCFSVLLGALIAFVPMAIVSAATPLEATARTFREPASGLKFVLVPAGRFTMGSSFAETQPAAEQRWFVDEQPPHGVLISNAFWLATTETTVSAFRVFVDETGYVTTAERLGESLGRYELKEQGGKKSGQWAMGKGLSWRAPGWILEDSHPVVHVSWEDADAFVRWMRDKTGRPFRLPTEAEWEYAAGGSAHSVYSWGDAAPSTGREGNIADAQFAQAYPDWKYPVIKSMSDGFVYTAPVGSFQPNNWGLFDMTGNVWEWCSDRYAKDIYGAFERIDPLGPDSGSNRVHRGGGFDWELPYLRVAKRRSASEAMSAVNVGFRIALSQ